MIKRLSAARPGRSRSVQSRTHRWSWVRADTAALPPRQVEAPEELQVEGVAAVQQGEAQDVGLIVHHVVQPEQREVLRTEEEEGCDVKHEKGALHMTGRTTGGGGGGGHDGPDWGFL